MGTVDVGPDKHSLAFKFDLDRATWVLVGVAVLISVTQILSWFLQSVGYESPLLSVLYFFDPNREATFSAWFSSLLLAATGVGAWAARGRVGDSSRRRFVALAVLLFYLSMDKATESHDVLIRLMRQYVDLQRWTFVWVVLAVLGALYLLGLFRGLPRPARFGLVLGAAVFLFGAVVLDMAGTIAHEAGGAGETSTAFSIAEELAEMVGIIVLGRTCFLIAGLGPGGFASRDVLPRRLGETRAG